MVGGGINDSAALACADVGVAVCKGADISREAAGVLLLQDDLRKLVSAIDIARHAIGLVRQDFQLIAGLNTLALALALPSRRVSPGLIAAISNGSAVLASLNSLRPPPAASSSGGLQPTDRWWAEAHPTRQTAD